jgi:transmembrane sensor
MKDLKATQRISQQAREEAVERFIELREDEASAATRESFQAWLRKSPENVHAYLRISALWEETVLLEECEWLNTEEITREARNQSNVLELEPASPPAPSVSAAASAVGTRSARRRRAWVAVATSAALLLLIGVVIHHALRESTYVTGFAEQRTIALKDGSSIILNSRSRVRVRYSDHLRAADLLEGQAEKKT